MAEGKVRRSSLRARIVAVASVAALVAPALASCNQPCEGTTCQSDARAIDMVCAARTEDGQPACETSGGAERTTGITEDTTGFHLGADGTLTIRMQPLVQELALYGATNLEIDVLAAATDGSATLSSSLTWGSCGNDCPPPSSPQQHALTEDYAWITVALGGAVPLTTIPTDATLTISGTGVDIADLRTRADTLAACSIAGPIGARR